MCPAAAPVPAPTGVQAPPRRTCCCSRLSTEPLLPLRRFLWKAAISSVLIRRTFCCCSCFSSSS